MKKKIAIFGNGWSDEFIQMLLMGVRECAEKNNVDVFTFVDFGAGNTDAYNWGEINLMHLPKFEEFDGAILLANTFNVREMEDYLVAETRRVNLPTVSLEYEIENMDFMGTDNYSGMYELTKHMLEVHEARDIVYISGLMNSKENEIRCRALRDAMAEYGLSLEDDHIILGEYSDVTVQSRLPEWLEKHGKLPDVFVCANDVMAMGACLWLQNAGYSVPKDVAVTGFDSIETARFCYPPISSVERNWDRLGYNSLQYLLDKIEGKDVEIPAKMKSRFAVAESCGCRADDEEETKATVLNSNYGKRREYMEFDSHNRDLYQKICNIKTIEELQESLGVFFAANNNYEGKNLAVCMDPSYFRNTSEGISLLTDAYPDEMEMLCGTKDGVKLETKRFPVKDIYPGYDPNTEEAHVFVCVPLHTREFAMGYVAFMDHEQVVENYKLYTWSRHMIQYLEQARKNIQLEEMTKKLTELSVTDGLTGVYNRMGYEKMAMPYLEKCRLEGKHGVIMFADINRMKVINDRYGHMQGDLAICIVANALKNALPEEWIVVRYGGDEFLAAGTCVDHDQAEEFKANFYRMLEEESKARKAVFDMSVSVGDVWVDDDATLSIEECFKKADASMYEMKKQQHALYS